MRLQIHTAVTRHSAIAKVMIRVAEELAQAHDVVLVSKDVGQALTTDLPVSRKPVAGHFPIFVLGNHPWFAASLRQARKHAGVVVLHDVTLFDLAVSAVSPRVLDRHVELAGGAEQSDLLRQWRTLPNGEDALWSLRKAVPCTALATSMARGVVTHSRAAAAAVAPLALGPTHVIPLPVVLEDGERVLPAAVQALRQDHPHVIVSVGHVNRNRAITDLVRAIAASPSLRGSTALVLAGPFEPAYASEVRSLATLAGVTVHFTGQLTDAELRGVIHVANACAALRDPVLEAASASVLDQMAAGRPVIVFDHGHFSELPQGTVIPVPPSDGRIPLLTAALETALDVTKGRAVAEAGARYVREVHSTQHYAAQLLVAIDRARTAIPSCDAITQIDRGFVRLGVAGDATICRTLARSAGELLAPWQAGSPAPGSSHLASAIESEEALLALLESRSLGGKHWSRTIEVETFPESLRHRSPEVVVTAAYRGALGRPPDPGGFRDNLAWLRSGGTGVELARILIQSPEAASLPPQHLRRVRWKIDQLGRAPGSVGYPPLLDETETGGLPFEAWLAVNAAFLGCTGRPPTPEEADWGRQVLHWRGREALLRDVFRSREARLHLYGRSSRSRIRRSLLGGRISVARAAAADAQERILAALMLERLDRPTTRLDPNPRPRHG
jgi:glycosyltransferase involved in cell wall biosynthesis